MCDIICDNYGEAYWDCECEDAVDGEFDLDDDY